MSAQTDIAHLTAAELLSGYRDKTLSPVEATQAGLDRIERHDASVNAFCLVDADGALGQARASEERWRRGAPDGLLDGVPVGIKDLMLTTGWPSRRGSRLTDPDARDVTDSPSVASLRRHAAVFLGKTTTPELGWKAVTDSPLTGITRNPWDPARTAGGSSGGSGVAVALGMCPLATGSDGGGSIRIPASFCGIVGLKPTYGQVPLWPMTPYGTLAHHGPMTWTVADAALMLDVLAESDPRDGTAYPPPARPFRERLAGGIDGVRIAYAPTLFGVEVDVEVGAAVAAVARALEALGARVEQVELDVEDPLRMFEVLWNAGAAQATSAWQGADREQMDPGLVRIADDGARTSAVEYVAASVARGQLSTRFGELHRDHDLLLTPSVPAPPFAAGRDVPEGWHDHRWPTWAPFSYPFNLTQQPAISVPCGMTGAGLPIGAQLVGRRHEDALVLRAAHSYQQAHPLTGHRPA